MFFPCYASRSRASEILEILEIFLGVHGAILEICSQASESWKSFSDMSEKLTLSMVFFILGNSRTFTV